MKLGIFEVLKARLLPFSSAIISCLMSLAGAYTLARIAWSGPSGHMFVVAGFSLLVVLLIFQLWRIHNLYDAIDNQNLEKEPLLRRAVNEAVRSFTWGNAIFALLALAVFQYHLSK